MSTSPGTSPNQARNARFAAGNDSTVTAPVSSISRRTDQIHRPVFASVLRTRTLPLSGRRAARRDHGGTQLSIVDSYLQITEVTIHDPSSKPGRAGLGAGAGLGQGAGDQDPGQVLAVGAGGADVVGGAGALGGVRGRLGRGRAAGQGGLHRSEERRVG